MANRPHKVLVVDDEPLIRAYVRQVLEDGGHVALEAASADEAIALLAEGDFTLMLSAAWTALL